MTTAQTILSQLGGGKFCAMTGAKDFSDTGDGLMFSLPQRMCRNKTNKVMIRLDDSDTYSVEFFNIRGVDVKSISTHQMVYADMLAKTISDQTGLAVRL